jgi:two-component sensor histidine kinase
LGGAAEPGAGVDTDAEDAAQELAHRLRQQQLTMEFGIFSLKTHNIDDLLQQAASVCANGLRSKLCKILEHFPGDGDFLVRSGVGWKPGVIGHARIGGDLASPAGYAFQTGEPVISNHLTTEGRFRTPALLVEHGVLRAVNVLIQGEDGKRFGVLEVDSPDPGRFTEADSTFLQGFANLLGVAIERQSAEEALKKSEQLLHESLARQELLTQEIGHRVKNSLAIVAGLLHMQGRLSEDPHLTRALADAEARVLAVANVHDRLWRRTDALSVNLSEFFVELCQRFAESGPSHSLHCTADSVVIPSDKAVTLGLLANELITNAFKYAYDGGAGEVSISVIKTESGRLRLEVSDKGCGLPAEIDAKTTNSLGMKLIAALSRQLGGLPEWHDERPGTRFALEFDS